MAVFQLVLVVQFPDGTTGSPSWPGEMAIGECELLDTRSDLDFDIRVM